MEISNQQVLLKHSCVKEHRFISGKMADKNFSDVTLAYADPNLLLCWEEKVKQGAECNLLLKHSKGQIKTILRTRSAKILYPKVLPSAALLFTPEEKKKKEQGNKKKKLEALLSYHQYLVKDKGLPPSRIMLFQEIPQSYRILCSVLLGTADNVIWPVLIFQVVAHSGEVKWIK